MPIIIILIIIGLICLTAGKNEKGDGSASNSKKRSSARRYCPTCGAPLRPGARECGYCGDCW